MSELIEKIRGTLVGAGRSMWAFYLANRTLVLSGLTIISIFLIVWARLGFTLEFSQFFASGTLPVTLSSNPTTVPNGGTITLSWDGTGAANCSPTSNPTNSQWAGTKLAVGSQQITNLTQTTTFTISCAYLKAEGAASVVVVVSSPTPTPTPSPSTTVLPIVQSTAPSAPRSASTPTPTPAVVAPATLTANCTTGKLPVVLKWNTVANQTQNSLIKFTDGANNTAIVSQNTAPYTIKYLDSQLVAGHIYLYRVRTAPGIVSNDITASVASDGTCTINPSTSTPTPTPTATTPPPTPTPSSSALTCGPVDQTVAIGQSATLDAAGGTGPYSWVALGGSPANGTGSHFVTSYAGPGDYQVGLLDAQNQSTQCNIHVTGTGATATPAPADMTLVSTGRNASISGVSASTVSASGGQTVEVTAVIGDPRSDAIVSNIAVHALLPAGITYVPGSTTINNGPAGDGITTAGLSAGSLGSNQSVSVRFRVLVNGALFTVDQTPAVITLQASADGIATLSGQVTILVKKLTGRVGGVQTGPGDAVLVAFLVSSVMTLLYVSYTHTSVFRKREIESISEKQDPLDFRS